MSTPYPSQMTGAQIENALNKVNGLIAASNNGKILCIDNGAIAAKSAIEIQGGTIDPITITENGVYTHSANGGYSPITVNVSGGSSTAVAVAGVIKEEGYVCTATQGTFELESTSSGMQYMFCLPAIGTWTFSCHGVTSTVTFAAYEYKQFSVRPPTFIYKSGDGALVELYRYSQYNASTEDDNVKLTSSMISTGGYCETCIRTNSTVDITEFSTLSFDLDCSELGDETAYQGRFIVSSTPFQVDVFNQEIAERIVVNDTRHTKQINISNLTGNMYIGTSGSWAGHIYNIYLQ